ncbi:peptidase C14, caspase domain-containing protein [Irpex rosettiformis]|uniref:Peptidase C14, caspase domain-containing protein n=1 Tax=Irpex rosettiformis TaxID=378272 RepID=A0ACB8U5X8_9APHY|nr:peptidase C14, caspase domain-containing protein [Irpex rosettiformis]
MSDSPPSPQLRTQPVKKALSIAVSYSDRPGIDDWYKIKHAHKDSDLIVDLLKKTFGYPPENITIMKDDGQCCPPTRNNIAMHHLVSNTMPGDHLVFHISGHWSLRKRTQRNSATEGQEENGIEELFWPCDVAIEHHDAVGKYILNDQIKDILVNGVPPGVNLVIISDCCHFGTIADLPHCHPDREKRTKALRIKEKERSKLVESPATESDEEESTERERAWRCSNGTRQGIPNVVCWSSCMSPQAAYNPNNAAGVFIQLLVEAICENVEQTHQELLHTVTERIEQIANVMSNCASVLNLPKPYLSALYSQTESLAISKIFGEK